MTCRLWHWSCPHRHWHNSRLCIPHTLARSWYYDYHYNYQEKMERIFNTIYTEKPFSFFPIFFLLTIYHDLLIQVSWEQNILNVKIKRCTLMLCKVKKNETCSPDEGLEPATLRLKVWCSTDWANRACSNMGGNFLLIICKQRTTNTIEKYRLVLMLSRLCHFLFDSNSLL